MEAGPPDRLVRTLSADGSVSAMSIVATALTREAVALRPTSTTASTVLGRVLMGALLFAANKKEGETVQLQLRGRGPLGTVTAIADSRLRVRGTLSHREAEVARRDDGRPNASAGVGRGTLTVVRHHPSWRTPYNGTVPMTMRDIAKDLTRYLLESEQAPSALGLSVEHDDAGGVVAAAGFLVQALPGADDSVLGELEANVKTLPRAAALVATGTSANALLDRVAGDVAFGERHTATPIFECTCNRTRALRALKMLDASEREEIVELGDTQEVNCEFCGRRYEIAAAEVARLG